MVKKLTSNIFIYGLTNGIKSLVPFLMLPILTMYLSAKDYGVLSLIEVSILFLAPFVTLNINSAINVEFFKLPKDELKLYISNALFLSFAFGIFIFIFTFLLREPLSGSLQLDSMIVMVLPIFALLRVVSSVVLGLYQVSDQPVRFAIYTLIQTIIDFALSYIFVVFFKSGYIGRLEGIYGAFIITTLYGLYLLYNMGYIVKIKTLAYSKEILSYGLPLIPHVLGGVILAMSDRFFISYFEGNDVVGYYTVSYQMAALLLLVSVSINQAWMPMLFKLLTDYSKNKKTIFTVTFSLGLLYTLCGLIIYLSSDYIYMLLVDEKFYSSKEYFPILLVGFMFQSYYYLFTNFLFFQKKTVLLAKLTFFSALLNLMLNYVFIKQYGAIGVAYATAITYGVYLFIVWYVSINSLKSEVLI